MTALNRDRGPAALPAEPVPAMPMRQGPRVGGGGGVIGRQEQRDAAQLDQARGGRRAIALVQREPGRTVALAEIDAVGRQLAAELGQGRCVQDGLVV